MKYKFLEIKNIKDKAIQDALASGAFIRAEKDGYTVINYILNTPETFPDVEDDASAAMREFRGLIFDSVTGNLIRRPLHKFFNHGERLETQGLSFEDSHVILEKLDGSMIAPFMTSDGKLRWGTKMGETDVSKQAEEFVNKNPEYVKFVELNIKNGVTPIFEWCSRKQRIVLDYSEDSLVLIAARHIKTGEYMDYETLALAQDGWNIPVVKVFSSENMSKDMMEKIKEQEGVEGIIVRFDSGHMVKVKSDWYCKLHKVKADIAQENNLVNLILSEKIDDLKAMLPPEDVSKIDHFTNQLEFAIKLATTTTHSLISALKENNVSRKQFSLEYSKDVEGWKHSIIYKSLDKETSWQDVYKFVIDYVLKNTNKQKNYRELKETARFMSNVDDWAEIEI